MSYKIEFETRIKGKWYVNHNETRLAESSYVAIGKANEHVTNEDSRAVVYQHIHTVEFTETMDSDNETALDQIRDLFNVVDRELFTINGKQSYENTLLILRKLAGAVDLFEAEDNSELWAIGEFGTCSLDSLIVGAYWFATDCHEYTLLSSLGCVYSPGVSHGCELETSELEAYNALITKHNEYNTTQLETR